jgi:heme-degrading monooxygenase HmoA
MADRVAFMTLGVLKKPVGQAEVQGFIDRLASVYTAADGSTGFFERSVRDVKTWEHSWGPVVRPACAPAELPLEQLAMTLSLWESLEAVAAYSYSGLHAEALARREEWFLKGPWPSYVAWWVAGDHRPRWTEGTERLDHLHTQGSTPKAFSFREPFDAQGARAVLDRAKVARAKRQG